MRLLILLLAVAFCAARPEPAHPALQEIGFGSYVIGGTNAAPGEFGWQLSQDRLGGAWSHSCGASLLSGMKALSAAHCVDGAAIGSIRVIAGLQDRNNHNGAQIAYLDRYVTHQQYNQGQETFNNDIAVFHLSSAIGETSNVQYARLPADNGNQRTNEQAVISGWGRTDASNNLPNTLQKATITILSQIECNARMSGVSGALTGPGQICIFDTAQNAGSCNGDSGGPLNAYQNNGGGQAVVAGVTSWVIQSGGACLPSYPSVYTRTSNFLAWINGN